MKPLPPTAAALLRAVVESGGAIPYRDPRVTTSGLTGLRRRDLARVEHHNSTPTVVLTGDGRRRGGLETVNSPRWQGHADGRHTHDLWTIRPAGTGWTLSYDGHAIGPRVFASLQEIDAYVRDADAEAASDAEAARRAK